MKQRRQTSSSASAASSVAPPQAAHAPSGAVPYTVRPGDTLGDIAKRGAGDVLAYRSLMASNGMDSDAIDVGDTLMIPRDWDLQALGVSATDPTPVLDEAANGLAPEAEAGLVERAFGMGQDLLADMAGGMTDALVDVQVAGQRAEDAAVDKLNALFATAYSYWTGPSEDVPETETDANARQDNLAEAVNEAGKEAERVDPDGFDWARAQAHIDAVMDENAGGYTGIQVAGLEVQTPYQNTSTRKGYRDPFFGGLSEADMLKQHPDVYYAVMGKASPEQVQGTMQVAVELGVVHEHAGKSEDEALTQRDIESWAKAESIGVDCIGLVMNMLVTSEAYGDFDAGQRSDYATMMNVNVTRFIAASTELESPDLWRPLDALTWVGHVVMVRDVKPLDGGIVFLDCVESSGSTGPRHSKYWYTPEGNASGAHFATSEAAAREGGQRGFIQSDACVRRAGQHDVEALSEQAGVT